MSNENTPYPKETFYQTLETSLINGNLSFVMGKFKAMSIKSKLSFIFHLKDNQNLELLRRFTNDQ